MTEYVAHITFRHLLNVDLTLAEHFSIGSSETTRMSSGISYQPSVVLNLRLDCVVLDKYNTVFNNLCANYRYKISLIIYGLNHWQ